MESFSGSRLLLARKRRTMTKKALSEESGISTTMLSNYESDLINRKPSIDTVKKLAEVLNFPIEFFFEEEIESLNVESINFRARSKMTRKQRDYAIATSSLSILLSNWLEKKLDLPSLDCPNCNGLDPVLAAQVVRSSWGLGILPISNMVDLLEAHGVKVFSTGDHHFDIDAFSFWDFYSDRPFVLLNTTKSGERSRMDAAHELGHIVMHKNISLECRNGKDLEKEANEFASAFLMPEFDVRSTAVKDGSLETYIKLKKRWKVSLSALIFRLNKLGMLSDWRYHSLFKQLSIKGMKKKEPNPIPRETSQLLSKAFRCLDSQGINRADIADDLSIPYEELVLLTFGPHIKIVK